MNRLDVELMSNSGCAVGKVPKAPERGKFVDEPTLVCVGGKPVLAYTFIEPALLARLETAVRTTKIRHAHRGRSGIPTHSSVFGVLPRVPARQDFCRWSTHTKDEPETLAALLEARKAVEALYAQVFPEQFGAHLKEVQENVCPDWLIEGPTPFTTFNVNVNYAIPYHRDTANMKNVLSNVLIVRRGMVGGELVCPELGLSLSQRSGALAIFDGQSILHGVMPLKRVSASSFRASIVFYTLSGVRHCLPPAQELTRLHHVRTEKEQRTTEERKALLEPFLHSRTTKKP